MPLSSSSTGGCLWCRRSSLASTNSCSSLSALKAMMIPAAEGQRQQCERIREHGTARSVTTSCMWHGGRCSRRCMLRCDHTNRGLAASQGAAEARVNEHGMMCQSKGPTCSAYKRDGCVHQGVPGLWAAVHRVQRQGDAHQHQLLRHVGHKEGGPPPVAAQPGLDLTEAPVLTSTKHPLLPAPSASQVHQEQGMKSIQCIHAARWPQRLMMALFAAACDCVLKAALQQLSLPGSLTS